MQRVIGLGWWVMAKAKTHNPTPNTLRIHNFGTMLEPRYIVGTERLDQ